MKRCAKCGAEWSEPAKLSFRAICPQCDSELHSCVNCRFYDPRAANHCHGDATEPVRAADRANFCEEFEWREETAPLKAPATVKNNAKRRLGKLFGD